MGVQNAESEMSTHSVGIGNTCELTLVERNITPGPAL